VLDHKIRQKQYLAKAQDAEEHAARSRSEAARADWMRIAQSYRDLARTS
jgi:hypothetical protein